ncbi:hypothetical protein MRB53_020432 [Persea americana]|uniref:Uncharacterized protein n=1 Tax=Persea americana TaxID=3435 RepID=A0ACC2L1J9_PERAE|nr:hypothetical protein MRB53_020432 [Persea americana]
MGGIKAISLHGILCLGKRSSPLLLVSWPRRSSSSLATLKHRKSLSPAAIFSKQVLPCGLPDAIGKILYKIILA